MAEQHFGEADHRKAVNLPHGRPFGVDADDVFLEGAAYFLLREAGAVPLLLNGLKNVTAVHLTCAFTPRPGRRLDDVLLKAVELR